MSYCHICLKTKWGGDFRKLGSFYSVMKVTKETNSVSYSPPKCSPKHSLSQWKSGQLNDSKTIKFQ